MACYKATFTFTYWTAQPVSDYATDWMIRSRIPFSTEVRGLSLIQSDHTDSGEHPPSYIMGTEVPFSEKKGQEGEADHSPPCSSKDQKDWSYTSAAAHDFKAYTATLPLALRKISGKSSNIIREQKRKIA
jgi:hypothetical protein